MAHATEKEPTNSQSSNTNSNSSSPVSQEPKDAVVKVKKERLSTSEDSNDGKDQQLRHLLENPKKSSDAPAAAAPPPRPPAVTPAQVRPAPQPINGQPKITSYFIPAKPAGNTPADPNAKATEDESKTPAIDLESIRGIFGWTTLETVHIPFILRQDAKFTAVRIIEKSLLKKYLQMLPPVVYSCTYIKSYFITDNEAKLLNEINQKHCDRQYGNELFTTEDLVVQLKDVEQLYDFLSTCYHKLTHHVSRGGGDDADAKKKESRCGIVRIDGRPIPFVHRNGTNHVPLSLLKRDVLLLESLDAMASKIESWEVAYMKFCCRVANIGSEFLSEQQSACMVVSLDDVRKAVGPSVQFHEWWPSSSSSSSVSSSSATSHQMLPSVAAAVANCWPQRSDGNYGVLNDPNRFKLPFHQLPSSTAAASSSATYVPPLHNLYACPTTSSGSERTTAGGVAVAAPDSNGLTPSSSGKAVGGCNGVKNGLVSPAATDPQAMLRVSYPVHAMMQSAFGGLSPNTTATNPQAFIYNGQWWGPMASGATDARRYPSTGGPSIHCQSLAAHCPQGPTQCSPNASQPLNPSNTLMYPPPPPSIIPSASIPGQHFAHYLHGCSGSEQPSTAASRMQGPSPLATAPRDGDVGVRRDSNGSILRPEKRHFSEHKTDGSRSRLVTPDHRRNPTPPQLRTNSTSRNSEGERTMSSSQLNGTFHILPRVTPPMVNSSSSNNASGSMPKISSLMNLGHGHLPSPSSSSSSSITNGIPMYDGVQNVPSHSAQETLNLFHSLESRSFLAQHLLGKNTSTDGRSRTPYSENFVVAPGRSDAVQFLAGKMSSPKPANQVPADHVQRHHASLLDEVTGTPPPPLLLPRTAVDFTTYAANPAVTVPPRYPNGTAAVSSASKLEELLSSSFVDRFRKSAAAIGMVDSPAALSPRSPAGEQRVQNLVPRFKVQQVLLSGNKFRAVNAVENDFKSTLLVPVPEIARVIQPPVSNELCEHILTKVFGVRLYECSRGQEEVLIKYIDGSRRDKKFRLLCTDDVLKYLPHLCYSVNKLRDQEERERHSLSKRKRC